MRLDNLPEIVNVSRYKRGLIQPLQQRRNRIVPNDTARPKLDNRNNLASIPLSYRGQVLPAMDVFIENDHRRR